jgi:hypothetical protein
MGKPIPTCRPYLVLLLAGLALPVPSPGPRCALTAPFHPCRARAETRSLGGLLSVALSLGSPPPGIARRHASVEPGLSSIDPQKDQQRPSSRLTRVDIIRKWRAPQLAAAKMSGQGQISNIKKQLFRAKIVKGMLMIKINRCFTNIISSRGAAPLKWSTHSSPLTNSASSYSICSSSFMLELTDADEATVCGTG